MQVYGGSFFTENQEKTEKVFIDTTPPTPSRKKLYSGSAIYQQPVNMTNYYNSGGGCYDGNGVVQLADGQTKLVKELVKGDVIKNGIYESIVQCVVRTNVHKLIDVVKINNMLITPWHPVKSNEWVFPIDIHHPQKQYLNYVYNLVVKGYPSVTINGVECITLGHGLTGNVV
jgi:hypothetical protein